MSKTTTTDLPLSSSSPDAGVGTRARVQEQQEASARRPDEDPSAGKRNGTAIPSSRKMIDASGDIRSPLKVSDYMMSLGVQDNINIVEQPSRRPRVSPGAFHVGRTSSDDPENAMLLIDENHHSDDNYENRDTVLPDAPMTIMAHLAPDEEDIRARYQEQLETEVERIRRTLIVTPPDLDIVMADEVKTEDSLVPPGLSPRTKRWIIASIFLCLVVGAGLGGVVYSALQGNDGGGVQRNDEQGGPQNEEQGVDPLLEELRSLIAPTEDDFLPFLDATSPQSQALAWLRDDNITSTPGRSFETALERYVLAVLYYTTSGPFWNGFRLNDTDHCTWNLSYGDDYNFGVFCNKDTGTMNFLSMWGNNLFGTIPWELVLLTNLKTLQLADNILAGTIPSRIAELTELEVFWAWRNRLTGTLPPLLPPSMLEFDVSENRLNGTLPESWMTGIPALQMLSVSENPITGTLPTHIGLLSDLLSLGLSTLMNGTLPSELGLLSSLITVELQSSSFTGSLNDTICNLPNMSLLWADCAEVDCPCCNFCCYDDEAECTYMLGDSDDGDSGSRW